MLKDEAQEAIDSIKKMDRQLRGEEIDVDEVAREHTAARHHSSIHSIDKNMLDPSLKFRLASFAIDDALKARGDYGKLHVHDKTQHVQRAFAIETSVYFQYLFFMAVAAHVLVAFFEDNYFTAGVVVTAMCLSVYASDVVLTYVYMGYRGMLRNVWQLYKCGIVLLLLIDFVIFCSGGSVQPFRLLRPWIVLSRDLELRRVFKAIVRMWPVILKCLIVIFVHVLFFAALGTRLFMVDYHAADIYEPGDDTDYGGMFDSIGPTLVHFFILLSTENYPDVMMGAYRAHRRNFTFFGAFLIFSIFFVTPMILALMMVCACLTHSLARR